MSNMYVQPTGLEGFTPTQTEVPSVINRSGAALEYGDVVAFDITASATELTTSSASTYLVGGDNTIWNTVRNVAAADVEAGILGVVTEKDGIADNERGRVTLYGVLDVYVIAASGNITPGSKLVAISGSQDLDGVTAAGERVVGFYAGSELVTPTTHVRGQVLFDGVGGFGTI